MTADNRQYAATILLEDVTWRLARALGHTNPTQKMDATRFLELVDEAEEQLWRLRDLKYLKK